MSSESGFCEAMEQTSIVSFFGGEVFEDEELGGEGEYGGYGTSSVPDGGGADSCKNACLGNFEHFQPP